MKVSWNFAARCQNEICEEKEKKWKFRKYCGFFKKF